MSLRQAQQGAAHLVAILVLVLVVGVAAVGYRTYQASQDKKTATPSSNQTEQSDGVPDSIENEGDLMQADKAVEATPVKSDLDTDGLDDGLGELF